MAAIGALPQRGCHPQELGIIGEGAQQLEVQRLKAGLAECIGGGCLSLERCRWANPGDRGARLGPGARYWIDGPPP